MRKYQQDKLLIPNYQRPCVEKHVKIKVLKKVFYNLKSSYIRTNYHLFLEKNHTTYNSITRNKNYCSVTSRGRSVYRAFRMARHAVHQKGSAGLLIGVQKAAW